MASTGSAPTITVGYWGIRGLAAPLRMMLMHAGVTFNNVSYDLKVTPESRDPGLWATVKPALRKRNPLINLPYIEDSGTLITQTNACLAHLGRKLGMWGKTEAEVAECEQLLCEAMDLRNLMTRFAYGLPAGGDAAALEEAGWKLLGGVTRSEGAYTGSLYKLNAWLIRNEAGGSKFFVGSSATAPDFHIWEMLDQYRLLASTLRAPDPLGTFPHLAQFHTSFATLPENAAYLGSKLATLPCNNKIAAFASAPGGKTYVPGDPADWDGSSGIY